MELPKTWTLIAENRYSVGDQLIGSRWVSVEGAGMLPEDARALVASGLLLMAQKRLENGRMGLVVKAANLKN